MNEIAPDGLPWNPSSYKGLVINVALTGAVPSKSKFPRLPVTPEEIARDVQNCASLGAQVFHLHMRDNTGKPTQDPRLYEETIERIRDTNPEVLLCVTTSSRASTDFEDRLTPLKLKLSRQPELASLSIGSFNFPDSISRNPLVEIKALAEYMLKVGVKPELEVFEPGMVSMALNLVRQGEIAHPMVFNILLGNNGTSSLTASSITPFLTQFDTSTEWALAGIGRFQRKAILLGVALGGNVRVGLEDDPVGDGNGTWSNMDSVSIAVQAAKLVNRPLASCEEVRTRFGI